MTNQIINTNPKNIEDPITYSEIFYSIQGEGLYTGVPTVWLRLFSCNLNCDGFGQEDPTDPETYELPYKDLDTQAFNRIEDLPVFEKGCDSSYSWSKKFKHLNYVDSAKEVAERLFSECPVSGKNGEWPKHVHLCFTGGEPLTKPNQRQIIKVLLELEKQGRLPWFVTFETNGTQTLLPEMVECLNDMSSYGTEYLFSLSPKLFSVSGEKSEKAIKPEVISGYLRSIDEADFTLKFVLTDNPNAWDELEDVLDLYESEIQEQGLGYHLPVDTIREGKVWIMPVGGTIEGQSGEVSGHPTAGDVANMALERGYNVSARVHAYLWNNEIGV